MILGFILMAQPKIPTLPLAPDHLRINARGTPIDVPMWVLRKAPSLLEGYTPESGPLYLNFSADRVNHLVDVLMGRARIGGQLDFAVFAEFGLPPIPPDEGRIRVICEHPEHLEWREDHPRKLWERYPSLEKRLVRVESPLGSYETITFSQHPGEIDSLVRALGAKIFAREISSRLFREFDLSYGDLEYTDFQYLKSWSQFQNHGLYVPSSCTRNSIYSHLHPDYLEIGNRVVGCLNSHYPMTLKIRGQSFTYASDGRYFRLTRKDWKKLGLDPSEAVFLGLPPACLDRYLELRDGLPTTSEEEKSS